MLIRIPVYISSWLKPSAVGHLHLLLVDSGWRSAALGASTQTAASTASAWRQQHLKFNNLRLRKSLDLPARGAARGMGSGALSREEARVGLRIRLEFVLPALSLVGSGDAREPVRHAPAAAFPLPAAWLQASRKRRIFCMWRSHPSPWGKRKQRLERASVWCLLSHKLPHAWFFQTGTRLHMQCRSRSAVAAS